MPTETVLVLAVVVGMFAVLMVALGFAWIWTNLPDARPAAKGAAATDTPATAGD